MSKDKSRAFIENPRELPERRDAKARLTDSREIYKPFPKEKLYTQASRCMDCGIPFCHSGCPLGNRIPDWNTLVYKKNWKEAYIQLRSTNNFPEFTGRICPAPCEAACVLGLVEDPVTIEQIEKEIIEYAFEAGWVNPVVPAFRTGKRVAVVGSGPAGLACADQLNKAGHMVTVFERDSHPGGLLRYGIPDFKLEKSVIERRVNLMAAEGVEFKTGVHVGVDVSHEEMMDYDAVILCIGATKPRDLPIPGRDLGGIHFAWDFLSQQNKRVSYEGLNGQRQSISAQGKDVIVIGGGDTGSDCVGTSNRQKAASVTQFELLPVPPSERSDDQPWPYYPMILRTSSSHEEGVDRHWSILTKSFEGAGDQVASLVTTEVSISKGDDGRMKLEEIDGTEKPWPAQLVLLAIGYAGPQKEGLVEKLGVELDGRGAISTNETYETNVPGVFAAGDGRRGQSLVVWAISEGREAAHAVDTYLMGKSTLPLKGAGDLPRFAPV